MSSSSPATSSFALPIAVACGAVVLAFLYNTFVASKDGADDKKPFLRNYLAIFCIGMALGFGYTCVASPAAGRTGAPTAAGGGPSPMSLVMAEIDLAEPDF